MKRIHFDNLQSWFWIGFMLLSMGFILVGFFEIFNFANSKVPKILSSCGFAMQTIYYSRMFWFRNYFQWNKKGANIRINSFLGKSLNFEEIIKTELTDKVLKITKSSGNKLAFDLNHIADEDVQKLHQIIVKSI
jgi:hypothetical protein